MKLIEPGAIAMLLFLAGCGDAPQADFGSPCVPGSTQACLGAAQCEGVQVCAADGQSYQACSCEGPSDAGTSTPGATSEDEASSSAEGSGTADVTSGGDSSDASSGGESGSDESGPGVDEWQDPTLTTDPVARERADVYEAQYWPYLSDLEFQIMDAWGDGRLTDEAAQEATYSSGWGLASYHSMDELIGLTHLMEITRDESHRSAYAALAAETLEITIPAISEGRGTEDCTSSPNTLHLCSSGNFRYLDAGHGTGAAGFVMNALYENPALREQYADELEVWANALVPILDRHSQWLESTEPTGAPHMPAKIAAGYLAVGKILDRSDYLDGFENIARLLAASAGTNTPVPWVGSDVSHARITMAVAHLAFREQLRGTMPEIITPSFFLDQGDIFETARQHRDYPECFDDGNVGHHGVLVRFSDTFADIVDPAYALDEVEPGRHAWGCVAETVAALAMGHATALSAADAGN